MTQMLLFPDPRPLVERLGREFFLAAPACPGVYLMRDAADAVLYVGKAKNLRRRLGSYRVANPDRLPRRHLRLLRAVARIELQACADELSALARESELLRSLRPKFNRAGTWPGIPRFLVWRRTGECLELKVTERPEDGWSSHGPTGRMAAASLRNVLARLLWCAVHPDLRASSLPLGWLHGHFQGVTVIHAGSQWQEAAAAVDNLFSTQPDSSIAWLQKQMSDRVHPFDKAVIEADLEALSDLC